MQSYLYSVFSAVAIAIHLIINFDLLTGRQGLSTARGVRYRGFLFGSLNPDVQSLEDYLGESKKIIDMIVDQSPDAVVTAVMRA